MIACPHCNEKTLPEFKINIAAPGKIFTCPSCNKDSQTPVWHFTLIMLIILGGITATIIDPLGPISSNLVFIVIGFKLLSMSAFTMTPIK